MPSNGPRYVLKGGGGGTKKLCKGVTSGPILTQIDLANVCQFGVNFGVQMCQFGGNFGVKMYQFGVNFEVQFGLQMCGQF